MSTLAKVVAIATLYKLLSVMNADVSESFKMVVVIISMLLCPLVILWP
jgi:NADH-quinone oxidoreductase subunit N